METVDLVGRSKTAMRMKYEAEAKVLGLRIGGLEGARKALGLSQRKISQLLLVDPSAWTRWAAKEQSFPDELAAPPHVYRSIAWFLALNEKYPAFEPSFWLRDVASGLDSTKQLSEEVSRLNQELAAEIVRIKQGQRRVVLQSRALIAIFALLLAVVLMKIL